MMVNATYVHVHACVILGMWRPATRKTRFDTLALDNYVPGKAIANFSNEVSDAHGFQQRERPSCMWRRSGNIPCAAACASQRRQPSLLAMTHAAIKRPRRASEHGLHTRCGPLCVSGLGKWPIDRCSDKDAGKHERKTPTHCGRTSIDKEREGERGKRRRETKRNGQSEKRKREKERETERKTRREREREKEGRRCISVHLFTDRCAQVRRSFGITSTVFFFLKRKRVLSCRLRFLREVWCAKL